MPSHFTHLIFAEDAVIKAFGDEGRAALKSHGNLLRFAAQGPDFFYHNQRTMPTGLRYGVAAHRHGFGTLVENMVKEALRLGAGAQSDLAAFIVGFCTHAFLDRWTHPYIGYRAGWVDPQRPETRAYFHCHPFLERIIDVMVLREKRGIGLAQFDFLPLVQCGKTLPYRVVKTLVKSLNASYPTMSYKSRDRRRVDNAYRDAMFFYKLTNHRNPSLYKLAFKKDRKDHFTQRHLALLHPFWIPDGYDFLNVASSPWCHPCSRDETSTAGFMQLYEEALGECVKALRCVHDAIDRRTVADGLAAMIGEQSLDTGRGTCVPQYCEPFPLSDILEQLYGKIEAGMG